MRETLLIICSCVKEGPRGPKGNSQKRKVTNGYKAYHTRFLPKSQDFDWKRRESAAIEGQSTTDTTYSGRLSKRYPTTTRRRNGQGRAAKRFVHFDRDEKTPRHPFGCRGGPEGTGDLPHSRKSPEPLKETPDFGGVLGQRGGDDGHGAAPHRQVPVGPPAFLLRGASKLPRHQGFALLTQNA